MISAHSTLLAFLLPEAGSTFAPEVDGLFNLILALTTFFFIIIIVSCVYFIFKYRQQKHEMGDPNAPTHNTPIELIWSVIPGILVFVFFFLGFFKFVDMITPPQNAYDIVVTAGEYKWRFYYPEYDAETEVLYVPVNVPVRLTLTSTDYIHSLFVPDFRTKQDAVPGRYVKMWFQAVKVGEHQIYCAEYCGVNHSTMMSKVVVLSPEDLKTVLDSETKGDPVEMGRKYYRLYCSSCHTDNGQPFTGPTFKGLFGSTRNVTVGGSPQTIAADENYIRESMMDPMSKLAVGYNPVMPTFKGTLSEDKIRYLLEYLKSIGTK